MHPSVVNCGCGLNKEYSGEVLQGVTRLPFDNADYAQVVIGRGNALSNPRGWVSVAPLKTKTGTQDNPLSP